MCAQTNLIREAAWKTGNNQEKGHVMKSLNATIEAKKQYLFTNVIREII
jgi:hypothetical protein